MSDLPVHYVTEEQLHELEVIVWGSRMMNPNDPKTFSDLIQVIRTQRVTDETPVPKVPPQ